MRCWQPYGLKYDATKFIAENAQTTPEIVCPHCSQTVRSRPLSRIYEELPEFYDTDKMEEWTLKDGRKARRVRQDTAWSSGPMTFDCLEIDGKREFEWSNAEMNSACGEEAFDPKGESCDHKEYVPSEDQEEGE